MRDQIVPRRVRHVTTPIDGHRLVFIALYAERHGIQIAEWFEERLTAAKRGRPLFTKMLKNLRRGEAQGVVIHKIDRSARNLRDWAELGELIDGGVLVHFAIDTFELASSAQQGYRLGNPASRRELAIRLCSNRTVAGKEVSIEPYFPLKIIAKRHHVTGGGR